MQNLSYATDDYNLKMPVKFWRKKLPVEHFFGEISLDWA